MFNKVIGFLIVMCCSLNTVACAQDAGTKLIDESLVVKTMSEAADKVLGDVDTSFASFEEDEELMSADGTIALIHKGEVTVTLPQGSELDMVVDAETLIYINERKSVAEDLKTGDKIFVYYVEEGGILKADWVDIIR